MRELVRHFRPFDYVFIGLALLLSFTPLLLTALFQPSQVPQSQLVAVVKINGEVVEEWPLAKDGPHQEVTYYPNEGQYNIVEIKGDTIRVKEDNSPDQIAVNSGWIRQEGQILVCLPHQLIIEIQQRGSSQETDTDDLILPI